MRKYQQIDVYIYQCVYWNALQTTFTIEKNTIYLDQTAPKVAVWPGLILFAF